MQITLNENELLDLDPNQPALLQLEKRLKIKELKVEASRRIQTIDGKYYSDIDWLRKSQNFQDIETAYFISLINKQTPTPSEIEAHSEARKELTKKDSVIVLYKEIKELINTLTLPEDVEVFDVANPSNWAGSLV